MPAFSASPDCVGIASPFTGADATALAEVVNREIVLALVAVGASKTVGEDAAFEIAAEAALDMGRRCFTVLTAGLLQPSFEVGLDDAIPQRPLGAAALVALGVWARRIERRLPSSRPILVG